jgi:hypothetical protein
MWYLLQILIAGYIGYFWTTMPGHTPNEFGHGLFLGGLIAWFVTLLLGSILDFTRRGRSTPVIRKSVTPLTARGQGSRLYKAQLARRAASSKGVRSLPGRRKYKAPASKVGS